MEQKNEYDDLIIKHLIKETTSSEEGLLQKWLNVSDDHRKYFEQTKRLWELAGAYHPAFTENREQDLRDTEGRLTKYPAKRSVFIREVYKVAVAVAAILIIAIGTFYLLKPLPTSSSEKIVLLSIDNIVHQMLPDGSEIWLNRNSSLTFTYGKEKNRTCEQPLLEFSEPPLM